MDVTDEEVSQSGRLDEEAEARSLMLASTGLFLSFSKMNERLNESNQRESELSGRRSERCTPDEREASCTGSSNGQQHACILHTTVTLQPSPIIQYPSILHSPSGARPTPHPERRKVSCRLTHPPCGEKQKRKQTYSHISRRRRDWQGGGGRGG